MTAIWYERYEPANFHTLLQWTEHKKNSDSFCRMLKTNTLVEMFFIKTVYINEHSCRTLDQQMTTPTLTLEMSVFSGIISYHCDNILNFRWVPFETFCLKNWNVQLITCFLENRDVTKSSKVPQTLKLFILGCLNIINNFLVFTVYWKFIDHPKQQTFVNRILIQLNYAMNKPLARAL